MYKPKPEQRNTNRLRLDIEPKLPNLMIIESQLHEAKGRRGTLIELPWQGFKTLQMWTLSVQWDTTGDLPVWTLYETYSGQSKMHWSNPYGQSDLPIMYDVICMSVSNEPVAKIPETLAPLPPPAPLSPPEPAPMPPVPAAPPNPYPYPPPYPYPGMPYPMDPNMMPPPYPVDPNQPPPQYGYPYPYPPPGGWPYQAPPPMPGAPYPIAPAAGAPAPFPAPAPAPAAPSSAPAQLVPTPFGPAPLDSGGGQGAPAKLKTDYGLVSKRAKIQLGALLINSTLISETTLDAALKIQELVEEGLISVEMAPRALFGFHSKGQAIGEYLPDFDAVKLPAKAGQQKAPQARSAGELKPAFDLLQKAGIITENDLNVAIGVRRKHGGDLFQILESAKKLDRKTLDAAIICLPMIREGLMKLEQCIIALNYCSRSRVDFDTALDEMEWPNPRKLRKDLFL